MNIQQVDNDIKKLQKALDLVASTESYFVKDKSTIMLYICEAINVLNDKKDRQINFIKQLQ